MDQNPEIVDFNHTQKDIDHLISLLEDLSKNSEQLAYLPEDKRLALLTAAGKLSRPSREEINKRRKHKNFLRRQLLMKKERTARAATGIRTARDTDIYKAPLQITNVDAAESNKERTLNSPRNCYVCKDEFTRLHFFYDTMCKRCGDFNYQKRFQTASLNGKVALITGSRLKIGYQASLMMLRAGATVIATTRFPVDSALRYSKESDFSQWGSRLQIYGLDLRHTPSVEIFTSHIEHKYHRLDILINNAAQTVRRPPGFYAHLMDNENVDPKTLSEKVQSIIGGYTAFKKQLDAVCDSQAVPSSELPVAWHGQGPGIGIRASAQLSQIPYAYDNSLPTKEVFPEGKLDMDLQQVDLRKTNSWRLCLGEIQAPEMLEVQLVNAVAPFVLCNRLLPLMKKDYTGQKHIVNVSAMEGKFNRFKQASRHPHTNMAKAALNMLTHTAAQDLAKDGIFINAVDTGWVTDEDPAVLASLKQKVHDFQPPLDIVDGAARVCDPFFDGILTGKHWSGKFLKDYQPIDW
ncbi:MAG: SDR family oxidoreductase [Desulfobacterales bacterium]|nr:SDR family oxidoreductase [Desulfobacterales bacterium]